MPLLNALRNAGRKAATGLRQTHPNNKHQNGGGGTGSRSLHTSPRHSAPASHTGTGPKPTTTLNQIRPRNPANQLFSSTRTFFTTVINQLGAPGFKVPQSLNQLGAPGFTARPLTIQHGLSLPVRHALRNNNFRSLGSGTFLPRAPQVPIRGPIASQVGLGSARNFSSSRPIFQNLVDNVPVALRALYEADLDDLKEGRNKRFARRRMALRTKKTSPKLASKLKASQTIRKPVIEKDEKKKGFDAVEFERYFPAPAAPAVTTTLLIPLAPTPTNRVPLSALEEYLYHDDMAGGRPHTTPGRFLPLPEIGQIHGSHTNHALRVSSLFARLDQANVWSRGVVCSAYSGPGAGIIRPRRRAAASHDEIKLDGSASSHLHDLEGVCTVLKVEFQGWTEAEVRGVIGESGKGWCALEEVWVEDENDQSGFLSAAEDEGHSLFSDSGLSSPAFGASPRSLPNEVSFDIGTPAIDPAQSFILPTLDFSSSFLAERPDGSQNAPPIIVDYDDPWVDTDGLSSSDIEDGYMSASDSEGSLLSRSSSGLSFEEVRSVSMTSSPSQRQDPAWSSIRFSSRFHHAVTTEDEAREPRETMF